MSNLRSLALAAGVASLVAAPGLAGAAPPSNDENAATAIAIIASAFPKADIRASGPNAFIKIATTNGRTQVVYLSGAAYGPAAAPIRVISSNAAEITGPVDTALAIRLLTENSVGLSYGYWALSKVTADGKRTLSYQVEIGANTPGAAVQAVMSTVARVSDAMEAELTGKDAF